jgi:tetratricopeptide (TPR) repeat protein
MTDRKSLCLNMIVKNEMANLARCLSAVAPYIDCWVIGDTGSTDGTQDFIRDFFAARSLPGELHSFPFHDFEQARNAALDCAYASPLAYDYLLLDDADMELVVEDEDFRTRLEAPCYTLLQRSGVSYWNARIVRRDAGARYHGVTHEYLDVPGGTKPLHGVWYKDHASGSNRVDKFERDIRLLLEGLKQEPDSHRYWFYLAQSYRDAGQTERAAEAYAKRAEMGGWDEEAWYARLQLARCQRKLGDEGGFVRHALAAFNQRPHRAEPLYDLARFYRERGMTEASVLFSEDGIGLGRPDGDTLFIEDFVYQTGLKEEYSIAANYARDPARKDRGFAACNWLALGREVPAASRGLARSNLRFYVQPASAMMPSFAARAVGFAAPDGYHPTNPSITRHGDEIVLVHRAVNFTLTEAGEYHSSDGAAIHTRNFLLRLSPALDIESSTEILPPADLPAPAYPEVRGFEDARLFTWRDALWCCTTVRELTPEGWCQQVLARIDASAQGPCRLADWRVLAPAGPIRHEKNWMPLVAGEQLQFIYRCDPTRLLDDGARTVAETTPAIAAEEFRGGTQAIEFDGGWLALIHEVLGGATDKNRVYHHRFIRFDAAGTLRGVSRPFFFREKGVEFAAGLAWHPDGRRLLISYGVDDREAWIATVDAAEVWVVLENVERLPWGGLPASEGKRPARARDRVASDTPADMKPSTPVTTDVAAIQAGSLPKIPRIFHFITGLDRNFGGRPFAFIHYMAILSALRVNPGFRAKVYYHYEPSGPYWDAIKNEVQCVPVDLPTEVFGNPVNHFAHKADVLRMRILLEQGGIYLDLDTICQRPFEPLLDGRVVMGREEKLHEDGSRTNVGLCNATIIAPPNAEFLRLWYEAYRDFVGGLSGDGWNKFSVQLPMTLAKEHPDLLRIEPATSFFWPSWDKEGIASMFSRDCEFPEAYSFHLWAGESWNLAKDLKVDTVRTVDTTYNKIARRFIEHDDTISIIKDRF